MKFKVGDWVIINGDTNGGLSNRRAQLKKYIKKDKKWDVVLDPTDDDYSILMYFCRYSINEFRLDYKSANKQKIKDFLND